MQPRCFLCPRKAKSYLRSWLSDGTLEWIQLRRLWIGPTIWLSEIFPRLQVAGGSSPTPISYATPGCMWKCTLTCSLVSTCKSLMGNYYAQVYATPFHWVAVYPMETKAADVHYSLDTLFQRVGVPRIIIPDNS